MTATFTLDGRPVPFTEGQTVLQALEHADRAMYYAKNNGRNQVTAIGFDPDTPNLG